MSKLHCPHCNELLIDPPTHCKKCGSENIGSSNFAGNPDYEWFCLDCEYTYRLLGKSDKTIIKESKLWKKGVERK